MRRKVPILISTKHQTSHALKDSGVETLCGKRLSALVGYKSAMPWQDVTCKICRRILGM
jgi:hypothetical protein